LTDWSLAGPQWELAGPQWELAGPQWELALPDARLVDMSTLWAAVGLVLLVFYLLVIARMVVETTRSFARSWRPAGATAVGLELVYVVTDPPMKLLRRIIPPLRMGGISLDLSVIVLLIIIIVLRSIVASLEVA
jgi:YggT family protein